MKKSKKFLSVLLTICMVLSLAAPAFAADTSSGSDTTVKVVLPEDRETGVYASGVLPSGVRYWILHPTDEQLLALEKTRAFNFKCKVGVPIADGTGNNGARLGDASYYIADPDQYAVVKIGGLPSKMPTINVGLYYENAMSGEWTANASGNSLVVFDLGSNKNYPIYFKVSTQELETATVDFTVYSSATDPSQA